MHHRTLSRQNRLVERVTGERQPVSIWMKSRVIEVAKNERGEPKWSQRSSGRDAAVLILPERQVSLWMEHGFVLVLARVIVKSHREWDDVSGDDVSVYCL